jgi:hypothetical protein
MKMDKHSKYRPLLDKIQSEIMLAEVGVTGVYQYMLEALDGAEKFELALREELEVLKQSIPKIKADAIRSVTEQGFEYSVEHGPWDNDCVISQYVINDYADKIEAE